jgi:hypothetical protein
LTLEVLTELVLNDSISSTFSGIRCFVTDVREDEIALKHQSTFQLATQRHMPKDTEIAYFHTPLCVPFCLKLLVQFVPFS